MSPELERICGELLPEPLFHASLGSKELFHSNLLPWLADKYPDEMAGVMAAWSEADPGATHTPTKRKTRRLDLVFRLPGRWPLVVENKMFAIPNPGQLIAYDSTIRDEAADASKLLLALMPPGPLPPGWQSASYGELAAALEHATEGIWAQDAFDGEILTHYISMIRNLHLLVSEIGVPGESDGLAIPSGMRPPLRSIRLESVFEKSRVSAVSGDVRQAVRDRGWDASEFIFDSGMTRGLALLSAYRRIRDDEYLGWQIQGDQFRLAVKVATANRGSGRADREAYVRASYDDWFDFSSLYEVAPDLAGLPGRRGDPNRLNSYEPDFAYLYVRCGGITRRQIVAAGLRYLERAEAFIV